MREKTNIFKKFIGCIYDIRSFPKYIKEGLGRAVLYAFLLMVFVGLIKGIFLGSQFKKYVNETINIMNNSEYNFEISNGILNIDGEPIKIDEGSTLIYIDDNITTDKSNELSSITVHTDEYILVLRDGVIVNSSETGEQKVYFKDLFVNDIVTNQDMIDTLEFSGKIFLVMFVIINLLESIIVYIMNSILIAAAAMLTNVIMKLGFKFSDMFSLALYAGTLPALLQLALTIIIPGTYFGYAGVMGTLVYVFLILRTIRNDINEGMNLQ